MDSQNIGDSSKIGLYLTRPDRAETPALKMMQSAVNLMKQAECDAEQLQHRMNNVFSNLDQVRAIFSAAVASEQKRQQGQQEKNTEHMASFSLN